MYESTLLKISVEAEAFCVATCPSMASWVVNFISSFSFGVASMASG